MRIEGVLQSPQLSPNQESQELKVIDEQQIKTILYLGLKGDVQLKPASDHSVDTFA
jgi:hypothetical protein